MACSERQRFPAHDWRYPYLDEPGRFVSLLEDWIATTDPATADEQRLRAAMLDGGAAGGAISSDS
jgi:hypothetical protein